MLSHCHDLHKDLAARPTLARPNARKPAKIDYSSIPTATDDIHLWLSKAALDLGLKPIKRGT